jgi:ESS family glutamate:Na+ symporter
VKISAVELLGLGAVAWALGILLRRSLRFLDRLNIPASVLGGLIFSGAGVWLHSRSFNLEFDNTLRDVLMLAFFTSIGLGARLRVLRKGGPALVLLLVVSSAVAVLQNLVGIGMAKLTGVHSLLGIVVGSVTLTGGPATGLAFGPVFEAKGVAGASAVALAAAMAGIVAGGLLGGPLATLLIKRYRLTATPESVIGKRILEIREQASPPGTAIPEVLLLALSMGGGVVVSRYLEMLGAILPGYIGAMIVAAVIRNLLDGTGWVKISDTDVLRVGSIALNLFIAMALVSLRLWELQGLAIPLLIILAAQIVFILAVSCWPVFRIMGDDYQAAVISAGFVGYMLGITANAVANMDALVEKYGPAPRAYLSVPVVAAFLIDFTNALIIVRMANWFA